MAALEGFNDYLDSQGRRISPLIERGSNNIPQVVPLPDMTDLQGFSSKNPADVAQMSKLLGRYGYPSPDESVELQAKHLAGFNILPGDPRYAIEMERLANGQSGRALLSQARRTSEQYQTLKSIDGNTNQEMIRLAEGDDPCDRCDPLDGEIKTYKEFVQDNELPGGASCEGGDNCLCTLTPVV